MLIFASDLHLTDGTLGDAVSPEQLVKFIEGIPKPSAPVHLILLGDVFELLRSSLWSDLWNSNGSHVAPWTAMNAGFQGFPPKAANCVLQVLRGITARYAAVARSLKDQADWLHVHFVPGNHDYMVQLVPEARNEIVKFLSLHATDDIRAVLDAQRRFRGHYENASVFATHGHSTDPLNWHREEEGKWAFGDAIVLRLVNEFIAKACDHLGQPRHGGSSVARAIQDLDNVEPNEHLGLYFRYLLQTHFKNQNQAKKVLEIWDACVSNLLDLTDFKDAIYQDQDHWLVREALSLSRNFDFAQLLVEMKQRLQRLFDPRDSDLTAAQRLYERFPPGQHRFIVFGHTHRPRFEPLLGPDGHDPYYVNTGCWRRVVRRSGDQLQFRATFVRTTFHVDVEGGRAPTYRLLAEVESD